MDLTFIYIIVVFHHLIGLVLLGRNELNMLNEEQIWKLVDAKRAAFIALSDRVFETPETLYNEFASVSDHACV